MAPYHHDSNIFPNVYVIRSIILKQQLRHQEIKLMKETFQDDFQLSNDEPPKTFVGKYHSVLRKRKNANEEAIVPQRKEYKRKKVTYKSLKNLYQYWRIEMPLSQQHVYNFQNILAINEESMRNPESDESFLATKFYMKKVKSVTLQNQSLIFRLQDIDDTCTPIPYICERLKSFGDSKFLEIALTLEHLEDTLSEIHKKLHREPQCDETELDNFLHEMNSKLFFSQYSPNLLVISKGLLEMLGYNVQEFAIESIKYKSILYEFFSAEHYAGVLFKHLENINLMRDYLEGTMTLEEFCRRSLMVYNDFVYNRSNKKIKCEFFAGTSKQLTPYIEIKQVQSDQEDVRIISGEQEKRKGKVEEFRQAHRYSEIELLRKIINIPKQLDPNYTNKVCSYQFLESLMEENSEE